MQWLRHPLIRLAIKLVAVGFPLVRLQCHPPECHGFTWWHAKHPMPWQCNFSSVILSARRLMKFNSSVPVKEYVLLLSVLWSTMWHNLNPQNKHQENRIQIQCHNWNSPLTISISQVTRVMCSDVISNKANARCLPSSHFIQWKGFKRFTCTLVTLRPLVIVALTLSTSVRVYRPIHCALSLRDLPRRRVSSNSRTLSPTCKFISHDFLS
jgi:hypothetical protein